MNHTSGLHDYFEDKPEQGKPMIDILIDEPSRFWTPQEVIQWSRDNLKSHFPPGKGFHYSDTGYHMLGLIIEKITTKPFQEALKHYIFQPLGMNHSYLLHYSEPMVKSQYPVTLRFAQTTPYGRIFGYPRDVIGKSGSTFFSTELLVLYTYAHIPLF